MSHVEKNSSPNLIVPMIIAIAGFSMLILGLFKESWWIGLGFVVLVTALIAGLYAWGAATSIIRVAVIPSQLSSIRIQSETKFLPKRASAKFAVMILLLGVI